MGKPTGKNSRRKQAGKENAVPEQFNDSLLENLLGENVDEVVGRRSEVGRRSLGLVVADESIDDVEVNDDEKEKEERKRQLEGKKELENAEAAKTRRAEFESLNNLSQAELEQHYSKCIDMVNRNKVNAKNAFKLQLIDYMKTIVSNQWTKSENLALVSCTLGASAKIYAHRVDKVYADMIKIASNKGKDLEKDGSDDEENENENAEEGDDRPKKKRKNHANSSDEDDDDGGLIPDIDLSQMLLTEDELQKSKGDKEILERVSLPRGLEYFVEARVTDSNSILALNYTIFSHKNLCLSNNDVAINEPYYDGDYPTFDLCNYIANYKDIRNRFEILDEVDSPEESLDVVNSSLAYDPSANVVLPDSIRIDEDDAELGCDGAAPDASWVPDYDEEYLPEPDQAGLKSGQVSSTQPRLFSAETMSQYVSTNSCDYSFFDNSRLDFMAGPRHWRIKRTKSDKNEKPSEQSKKHQKKNFNLEFNADQIVEASKLYKEILNPQLAKKTVMTWSASKLKNPQEMSFSQKTLLGLTKNEHLLYVKKDSITNMIHNTDENHDIDVHMMNPDDFAADLGHEDDDDEGDDNLQTEARALSPEISVPLPPAENEGGVEVTDSAYELVPAPHRVNKIAIKCAKEQKKIDIKLLKNVMWDTMQLEEEKGKSIKFSEVYSKLPSQLPEEEAAELSFPIAFMALLHQANEKTLDLKGTEDFSDIVVSQG